MLDIHINSKNEKLTKHLNFLGVENKLAKKNKSKLDLSLNIFIKKNQKEALN